MTQNFKLWVRTFRYQKKYDIGGMNFIKNSLKPGDIAFDVGAHKGAYLNVMRKCVGKQGTIVGFEPQLILFEYLSSVKKTLHWSNARIEHLALSDKEGKLKLYIPANKIRQASSPGATLLSSKSQQDTDRIEEVDAETLDHYIERHQLKPVFLKIDVEGNELRVLEGGIEYLRTARPKILVEIEARHVGKEKVMDTFEFFKNLDYSGKFIRKKELIPLDRFSFDQHQNTGNRDIYCNNFIFE